MALLLPARTRRKRQLHGAYHIRPVLRVLVSDWRRYRDNWERQQDHFDRYGRPVSRRQPLRHTDIHNALPVPHHSHQQHLPDRSRRNLRLPSHNHRRRKHCPHGQPLLRLWLRPQPGLSHIPTKNWNQFLLKPQSDWNSNSFLQQKLDHARSPSNTQDVAIRCSRLVRHSLGTCESYLARWFYASVQLSASTCTRVRAKLYRIMVAQLDLLIEYSQRNLQLKTCSDRQ